MKVTANYSDGTTKDIAAADCEVSGYDTTKAGEQTVTVTYEGKTDTFKVTVKEAAKPDETDKTAVETDKRSVETDGSIIYTVFDACIMNVDCQNRV